MLSTRPTQKQIASALGVSPTALSLTLSDPETPRISKTKKNAILDYVKLHAPHLLSSRGKTRINLILPEINSYSGTIYGDIAKGVQDSCRNMGWSVNVQMAMVDALREAIFAEQVPDGVIAVVGRRKFASLKEVAKYVPVVLVNGKSDQGLCDVIDLNNREGVHKIVSTLHAVGHRRIVFLHDHVNSGGLLHHLADRVEAFFGSCLRLGLSFSCDDVFNSAEHGPSRTDPAYDAVFQLLSKLPNPPTAVCCFNDAVASQFIRAVQRAGAKIPQDFAVTGYDNHAVASQIVPGITTIEHNRKAMGEHAVELLAFRLVRKDLPYVSIVEEPHLILRESHLLPKSG